MVLGAGESMAALLNLKHRHMFAYVASHVGPPPPPLGAGDVEDLLRRVNEQVGFGRLSPQQGGV
jgi:hypothetical protein